MNKAIVVYDGNNLAFRNNMMSNLYTKTGKRTSAINGVLYSIPKDIASLKKGGYITTEIIFAWDSGRSDRRMELYKEYKGNRTRKTPEEEKQHREFLEQVRILHDFIPNLGVKSIKLKHKCEADDIISTITTEIKHYKKSWDKIIIVSADEDFLQLVNDYVVIYSPIKNVFYTKNNFEELVGIPQEYFIDYKILKGDNSDNIKGIHGIGDKTGKKLVLQYKGLEGILEHEEELSKAKVTSKIFTEEGLDILQRNLELMTLSPEVIKLGKENKKEISKVMKSYPYIDEHTIKNFLIEYQLSGILLKYTEWISTFKRVNEAYTE